MSKFGDPRFEYHATTAKLGAGMLLRIANADILPYDYVEYAQTMRRFASQAERAVADKHWRVSTSGLITSIARMEDAATAFNAARDRALTVQLPTATHTQVNATLLEVERQLTRPQGLVTRPWFRNLIYASDENNGYATMVLPSVNEAIRVGDESVVEREVADLGKHFDAASRALQSATALMK
jgi:N-acetylated-alpha-linked acidic dipeptidase